MRQRPCLQTESMPQVRPLYLLLLEEAEGAVTYLMAARRGLAIRGGAAPWAWGNLGKWKGGLLIGYFFE
jgi:hypothetical protein